MHLPLTIGTLGGTLTLVLASIPWTDIERSIVLTAIGATTSFLVSYLLKKLLDKKK